MLEGGFEPQSYDTFVAHVLQWAGAPPLILAGVALFFIVASWIGPAKNAARAGKALWGLTDEAVRRTVPLRLRALVSDVALGIFLVAASYLAVGSVESGSIAQVVAMVESCDTSGIDRCPPGTDPWALLTFRWLGSDVPVAATVAWAVGAWYGLMMLSVTNGSMLLGLLVGLPGLAVMAVGAAGVIVGGIWTFGGLVQMIWKDPVVILLMTSPGMLLLILGVAATMAHYREQG